MVMFKKELRIKNLVLLVAVLTFSHQTNAAVCEDDPDGLSSRLLIATRDGTREVKDLITAGANLEVRGDYRRTPLINAASNGHTEAVKILIAAGANIEATEQYRRTPLICATHNGHTEAVKILIAAGANIEATGRRNGTPLINAIRRGHIETVKVLITAGSNIEATTVGRYRRTPLVQAAYDGHTEIVKVLIAAGANIETTTDADTSFEMKCIMDKEKKWRNRGDLVKWYMAILTHGDSYVSVSKPETVAAASSVATSAYSDKLP